jgi:probable addiction module antidote protein
MKAARDYKQALIERLRDRREAEAYLNACLEDGDPRVFLIALRDVAAAHGTMSSFAKKCRLHRASLYNMTSRAGNPSIENVMKVLKCIGFRLRLEADRPSRAAA